MSSVVRKMTTLMEKLPVVAATFSPKIGGTECYVIIKKSADDAIVIRKAHEDPRYHHLAGQFKKPGAGMLIVIKDMVLEEFGLKITPQNSLMIGDTWHDEHAAKAMNIPFLEATIIHTP